MLPLRAFLRNVPPCTPPPGNTCPPIPPCTPPSRLTPPEAPSDFLGFGDPKNELVLRTASWGFTAQFQSEIYMAVLGPNSARLKLLSGFLGPKTDLCWDVTAFGMRVRHNGSGSMHIICVDHRRLIHIAHGAYYYMCRS